MSRLVEHADRWRLSLADGEVSEVRFDFAVVLIITDGDVRIEFRIEGPFEVHDEGMSRRVDPLGAPEQLAPVLGLLRRPVARIDASKDGRLEVGLSGQTTLSVEPDASYEAWTMAGPGATKVVASPGGGVGVWTDESGVETERRNR